MVVIQFYNVNLSGLSGLSGESIKSSVKSSKSLAPEMIFINEGIQAKIGRSCLKQTNIFFNHKAIEKCVSCLTKTADFDKYSYSTYGIRFDAHSVFSMLRCGRLGKNVIETRADNRSSPHAFFSVSSIERKIS